LTPPLPLPPPPPPLLLLLLLLLLHHQPQHRKWCHYAPLWWRRMRVCVPPPRLQHAWLHHRWRRGKVRWLHPQRCCRVAGRLAAPVWRRQA